MMATNKIVKSCLSSAAALTMKVVESAEKTKNNYVSQKEAGTCLAKEEH